MTPLQGNHWQAISCSLMRPNAMENYHEPLPIQEPNTHHQLRSDANNN